MNLKDQVSFFDGFVSRMRETMLKKGNDYSGADRLSNFKLGGAIIGLSGSKQALALISTKVARLGQLIDGKIPNNESKDDTLLDLANYTILLAMLEHDNL